MKLSSNNGTQLTIEELEKTRKTLGDIYERIIEINNGTYTHTFPEPIQFDYVSCPQLSNLVDSINDIMGKITKKVYQE